MREVTAKDWAFLCFFNIMKDKSAGGMITEILKLGSQRAYEIAKDAATKADPKQYIAAILKKKVDEINDKVPVGTRMGDYEWDGNKWKKWVAE